MEAIATHDLQSHRLDAVIREDPATRALWGRTHALASLFADRLRHEMGFSSDECRAALIDLFGAAMRQIE